MLHYGILPLENFQPAGTKDFKNSYHSTESFREYLLHGIIIQYYEMTQQKEAYCE